jgi:putative ABC transport system permease protein
MNGQVGWVGLATSLILVAFAAGISVWRRLGLERQLLWAAARALVQLLLVGGALTLLFEPGRSLWWSWAWVAGMVAYAGDVARRRAPEVPRFAPLAVAAFAGAALVTLGVIFGLRVFPLQGRTLVPIAGMMIGNSMTAMVLVARRLVDELRDKRDEVEARLALGQPSRRAASPYLRIALRSAISPQIETTKATGRRAAAAGGAGAGRGDVLDPGFGCGHHRGRRDRHRPAGVHPRPSPAAAGPAARNRPMRTRRSVGPSADHPSADPITHWP